MSFNFRLLSAVGFILFFLAPLSAQIPSGYYNSASGLTGQALKSALHNIIDDHVRYPYTSSSTDTWDIIADADEDPSNTSNVLVIYKNSSYSETNHTLWNREHSWPKSYGFASDGSCNYPYTDVHHLFAANISYNSARGNLPFADCNSGCNAEPVDGVSDANYWSGSGSTGSWEPWDDVKGDLARAMFYMATRYEGGTHGSTGCSEPDLILTNDRSLIQSSSSNQSVAYMGLLDTLLAWHAADPVDNYERDRNDVVYGYQGNRNPFVDHPEYVASIWGSGGGTGGGGTGGGGTGGGSGSVWINEIHYDNSSTDVNEGVEIAGPSGTNLSGYSLVAYNGSGGSSYATVNLSGTLSNQSNGYGTAWFSVSLQNGAPDGIALVDSSSNVIQFLSYEGSFTATNGAASGMTSTDIGKSETSSTPVGYALQLTGTGSAYADFTWDNASAHSRGAVNSGQSFTGGGGGGGGTPTGDPWINELHYDNSSTDVNEGVEIAGPAGTDLSGWQLVAYNGSGGTSYSTVNLSGTLSNQSNGYGAAWFAMSGLQNGSSDGIALVNPSGVAILFLSYEGTLTAANGPASGMVSTNIGVSETSSTSSSASLQLTGSGSSYGDFSWSGPSTHSRGTINSGQSF